jgi:hypothetical protein
MKKSNTVHQDLHVRLIIVVTAFIRNEGFILRHELLIHDDSNEIIELNKERFSGTMNARLNDYKNQLQEEGVEVGKGMFSYNDYNPNDIIIGEMIITDEAGHDVVVKDSSKRATPRVTDVEKFREEIIKSFSGHIDLSDELEVRELMWCLDRGHVCVFDLGYCHHEVIKSQQNCPYCISNDTRLTTSDSELKKVIFAAKKKLQQLNLRESFNKLNQQVRDDSLELLVVTPEEECENNYDFDILRCEGWREVYEKDPGKFYELVIGDVEESLSVNCIHENGASIEAYVQERMDGMTPKESVKLLGNDYLNAEYPSCSHRDYCSLYEKECN